MTETVSMLARTVFRCATCRYFDRGFCANTMARRERADLREGECSFWRASSFLTHDGGRRGDGQPRHA